MVSDPGARAQIIVFVLKKNERTRLPISEREAVCKLSRGRGVEGISVVPTDEPLDWVRWLRRSPGGDGKAGTGEERLQAAGLIVHSSATLCDIHFSDNSFEITCPGTQLMI